MVGIQSAASHTSSGVKEAISFGRKMWLDQDGKTNNGKWEQQLYLFMGEGTAAIELNSLKSNSLVFEPLAPVKGAIFPWH